MTEQHSCNSLSHKPLPNNTGILEERHSNSSHLVSPSSEVCQRSSSGVSQFAHAFCVSNSLPLPSTLWNSSSFLLLGAAGNKYMSSNQHPRLHHTLPKNQGSTWALCRILCCVSNLWMIIIENPFTNTKWMVLQEKPQVSLIKFLMQLINNVTKDKWFTSLLQILP